MYRVKEIFYSIQGEGYYSGRPAVFCRFTGCNLWSGLEKDRAHALCPFCDTDFAGTDGSYGGCYETARALAGQIRALWPKTERKVKPFVVCTGGEPLLQLDDALVAALHDEDFDIAIETNGTLKAPEGIDWICVSPKAACDLLLTSGDELKLVYPQTGAEPDKYASLDFRYFFLQPMDGPNHADALAQTVAYVLEHPRWRIGLQLHKILHVQ